jgi:hypothetical protein
MNSNIRRTDRGRRDIHLGVSQGRFERSQHRLDDNDRAGRLRERRLDEHRERIRRWLDGRLERRQQQLEDNEGRRENRPDESQGRQEHSQQLRLDHNDRDRGSQQLRLDDHRQRIQRFLDDNRAELRRQTMNHYAELVRQVSEMFAARLDSEQVRTALNSEYSAPLQIQERVFDGDDLTTSVTCTICLEDIARFARVSEPECKHVFHSECLFEWTKTRRTCPLCRQQL